ncbi:hypothetical protein FZEAL_7321 [Fusarium zealandicum]|uniref:Uncharacterized protein n=1 Tax=Fusarium zealandicum TaxID=1053134 RepID=A0A8H4XIL1_9HYPO|nr:hypothetical protein FZEAL_7321 [Fusarium zealandicum]
MAVARASSGPRFLSWSMTSLRRVYSTTTTPSYNTQTQKPPVDYSQRPRKTNSHIPSRVMRQQAARGAEQLQNQPQRKGIADPPPANADRAKKKKLKARGFYVPLNAQKFCTSKSGLQTTPDVWAFLNETGIEYNNSKAPMLDLGNEHRRIMENFSCSVQYSPKYILHPYQLQYLDPRRHPLTDAIIAKYQRKLAEEPLWVYVINRGGNAGIVKTITQRRITQSVWSALEERGYPRSGVRGTVIISLVNMQKAANFPAHMLGEAVAQAVEREWNAHLGERASRRKTRW